MAQTSKKKPHSKPSEKKYKNFLKLNGEHPLKDSCPDSYILYKTRKRTGGEVKFFNFDLAKEMGLIDSNHPYEMSKSLEKIIHDTFSFLIINEYDLENDIKFSAKELREGEYMATRYLQLQHPNKQGKTSGDGRSVWLGQIKKKSKTWDVSSAGVGATSLSPATHIYEKNFQSGDPSISYGCGYAEIDEGFETLFFSEVLKKNNYSTEQILAIIDFGNGISINVRAHENLIRPSHLFCWYKQRDHQALKAIVDYYIDSQISRGYWQDCPKNKKKYDYFLDRELEVFANLSADFEDDYIFCWLDWDGDNILMDGGIIDYGSIRQFGLFHHEYRFDDVDQYSTNIKEQKNKAKLIVNTFAGIRNFLKDENSKDLTKKDKKEISNKFDLLFNMRRQSNALKRIGFKQTQIEFLLKHCQKDITEYLKSFSYFERAKSSVGLVQVSDGITCDAIFCMRDILRVLPQVSLHRGEALKHAEFIEIIRSNYASDEDVALTPYKRKKINHFLKYYFKLVEEVAKEFNLTKENLLLEITMRSSVINRYDRVTGDSITHIVQKVLHADKKLSPEKISTLVRQFSESQNLSVDDKKKSSFRYHESSKMMKSFLKIVRNHRDGI